MPRSSSSARKNKKKADADADADSGDEGVAAAAVLGVEESEEDEILAAAMAASASSSSSRTTTKRTKKTAKKKTKTPTKAKTAAVKSPSSSPRKKESQKEAQARCLEARTTGLAMLAPLNLDSRESALNASGRRTLRDPQDDDYISPLNCLVRSQIEIFQASEDHPKAAFVHQIGLRCVNCATACLADPHNATATAGAEKFPQCKDNIGAAIRNWHRTHIVHCRYRPPEIVPIYDALRDMQVRAGNKGINYYQLAHDRLDLIDVSSGDIGGVALKPGSTQIMAQSSGMNLSRANAKGSTGSGGGTPKKKSSSTPLKGKGKVASSSPTTSTPPPRPRRRRNSARNPRPP